MSEQSRNEKTTTQGGKPACEGGICAVFERLIRFLMFVDLPIRRKFFFFGVGIFFWFCFIAGTGVVSMTAIHYYYHQVSANSIPYRQAIFTVLSRLEALEHDLDLMLSAKTSSLAETEMQAAREQVKGIRDTVSSLALKQTEANRFGTIVEQILQTMAKDNPDGMHYLQQVLERCDLIEQDLDGFFTMKRQALQGQNPTTTEMKASRAEIGKRVREAIAISETYAKQVSEDYKQTDEQIYHIIRSSVHTILAVLFIAMVLLLLFIRWIIIAFQPPIETIIKQIDLLSTGDIDQAQKATIRSKDEIGKLSKKFNRLIDSVYGMTVYKKVIEEDTSLDEVYQRLAEVFSRDLGLVDYTIFEVDTGKKEMRIGYPPLLGKNAPPHCHEEILQDCTLCRAVKTGRNISSFEYQGICRYFIEEEGKGYVCVPMMLSGKTGGVVQFVVPALGERPELDPETNRQLFEAENYIKQSLSVIEAKRLMNTLRDSAMVDAMTGLYNRRFLENHSKQLISGVLRRGTQIGLLMCDLDYFKQVNDTHGHDVGDQVLKELSTILKNSVREADVVLRFGGEEFLLLLIDINIDGAMAVAEKIRESVEQLKIKTGSTILQKTISIGVSEFPKDTDGFWQAIKYADVALYQAKEQGRNRVVRFVPEMWTHGDF